MTALLFRIIITIHHKHLSKNQWVNCQLIGYQNNAMQDINISYIENNFVILWETRLSTIGIHKLHDIHGSDKIHANSYRVFTKMAATKYPSVSHLVIWCPRYDGNRECVRSAQTNRSWKAEASQKLWESPRKAIAKFSSMRNSPKEEGHASKQDVNLTNSSRTARNRLIGTSGVALLMWGMQTVRDQK